MEDFGDGTEDVATTTSPAVECGDGSGDVSRGMCVIGLCDDTACASTRRVGSGEPSFDGVLVGARDQASSSGGVVQAESALDVGFAAICVIVADTRDRAVEGWAFGAVCGSV